MRPPLGGQLGERGPERWQDVTAVEREEPGLVRSRRVEDQMAKAHVEIAGDPLDVLIGVTGHDPPGNRPGPWAVGPHVLA